MERVTNMQELRIFMKDKEVDFRPNPSYIKLLNKNHSKVMILMEKETDCVECRNYAKYISYNGIEY